MLGYDLTVWRGTGTSPLASTTPFIRTGGMARTAFLRMRVLALLNAFHSHPVGSAKHVFHGLGDPEATPPPHRGVGLGMLRQCTPPTGCKRAGFAASSPAARRPSPIGEAGNPCAFPGHKKRTSWSTQDRRCVVPVYAACDRAHPPRGTALGAAECPCPPTYVEPVPATRTVVPADADNAAGTPTRPHGAPVKIEHRTHEQLETETLIVRKIKASQPHCKGGKWRQPSCSYHHLLSHWRGPGPCVYPSREGRS